MKIISFNVNGIRAILKKDFIKIFDSFDADIFSINETKFSEDEHLLFPFMPIGYSVFWTNSKLRKGYSGVCVYTKKQPLSIHYGLENGKYDEEGRLITLEYENFYYIACYVPNSGDELKRIDFRLQFEKDLRDYLHQLNLKKPIIYAGDLNVAHKEIDIKNPKTNMHNAGFTLQERNAFTELLSDGYFDGFRYLYPSKVEYSWWSYLFHAREKNTGWRLDYFVLSNSLKNQLKDVQIHQEIMGSDHCPIECDINL